MIFRTFEQWYGNLNLAVQNALKNNILAFANRSYTEGLCNGMEMSYVLLDPLNEGCRACAMGEFEMSSDMRSGKWVCRSEFERIQHIWMKENNDKSHGEKTTPTPCFVIKHHKRLQSSMTKKSPMEASEQML